MIEYHKINTCFKRNMEGDKKIILSEWTNPAYEYLKDNLWRWDEKIDGTNIRIDWDGTSVSFGGRTDNAQLPGDLVKKLVELFPAEKFSDFESVTLYGEGYGAGIQKVGVQYHAKEKDFILFDVMINGLWLSREDVKDVAEKLRIKLVPEIRVGTLIEAIDYARIGVQSNWGNFLSEGFVLRPLTELNDRRGNRIITKIKHVDFLNL